MLSTLLLVDEILPYPFFPYLHRGCSRTIPPRQVLLRSSTSTVVCNSLGSTLFQLPANDILKSNCHHQHQWGWILLRHSIVYSTAVEFALLRLIVHVFIHQNQVDLLD